jgi:hypothetical protein
VADALSANWCDNHIIIITMNVFRAGHRAAKTNPPIGGFEKSTQPETVLPSNGANLGLAPYL